MPAYQSKLATSLVSNESFSNIMLMIGGVSLRGATCERRGYISPRIRGQGINFLYMKHINGGGLFDESDRRNYGAC